MTMTPQYGAAEHEACAICGGKQRIAVSAHCAMCAEMLTLTLLRHAKAVASDPAGDHARALSDRGRREAGIIGTRLRDLGLTPDLALVSDARRTRETATIALAVWPNTIFSRVGPALYGASPMEILAELQQVSANEMSVVIIGHNPGIGDLARLLVAKGEPESLALLQERFPTSAAAVIEFEDASWRDLRRRSGTLRDLLVRDGAD